MDSYQYEAVSTGNDGKERKYTPLYRQLLVTSSLWIVVFVTGVAFGSPTVFIPQIRREANSTDAVTPEMVSWLSSVFAYTALPFIVVICSLMPIVGRKTLFMIIALNTLTFHLILYFSTSITHILISEVLLGMNFASNLTLLMTIVSEYTSPKYRCLFLTFKIATFFWGVWCANAIGTFCHWKYIPLTAIILLLNNVTIYFWPESPYWLASKGRFEECTKSYFWLMGKDETTIKELNHLIRSHTGNLNNPEKSYKTRKIVTIILTKTFYKPVLLCLVLILQFSFTGKMACSMYAIDIIKQITGSESAAYYGMLLLDGVTVTGMYCGSFLSKVVKRRTLLMTTGVLSEIFLGVLALYLYLIRLGLLSENIYVTACLLAGFSITVSMGPVIMVISVVGELMPIKYKSFATFITAIVYNISTGILLKVSPYLFVTFGMHGTFFFFSVVSGLCVVILYLYLPETKDKTLQEIEDMFDDNKNTPLM